LNAHSLAPAVPGTSHAEPHSISQSRLQRATKRSETALLWGSTGSAVQQFTAKDAAGSSRAYCTCQLHYVLPRRQITHAVTQRATNRSETALLCCRTGSALHQITAKDAAGSSQAYCTCRLHYVMPHQQLAHAAPHRARNALKQLCCAAGQAVPCNRSRQRMQPGSNQVLLHMPAASCPACTQRLAHAATHRATPCYQTAPAVPQHMQCSASVYNKDAAGSSQVCCRCQLHQVLLRPAPRARSHAQANASRTPGKTDASMHWQVPTAV